MLTTYVRTAFRTFRKSITYSILNLIGLTSGLIVFILITLYTSHEFSFDRYHENVDRIYRVYKEDDDNFYLGTNKYAVTPAPLAQALIDEFPEVSKTTRFNSRGNILVEANDVVHLEPRVYLADPDAFEIFSFKPISGKTSDFLRERNSVVLSRSAAIKFFGRTDVLNKVIRFQNEHPMKITGVFEDMPKNSHFVMDVVFQFESVMAINNQRLDNWNSNSYHTFLLLEEGASAQALQAKLPLLRAKYADDPIDEDGQETIFTVQALREVHFTRGVNFDIAPVSDAQKLYIYLGIAFMVLIIAGINYVNLATARAINRTREIGIRKVIGAQSKGLIFQFLVESFLMVCISLTFAIITLLFILPSFGQFVDRPLALNFASPQLLGGLLGLALILSVLAGLYPAWVLASFKPVESLKGKGGARQRGAFFRNALVIFQFAISSGLIISAIVLSKQLDFIQNADTGFTRDKILVLNIRDESIRNQMNVFNDELRKIPGVVTVAGSSSLPDNISSSANAKWPGRGKEVRIPIYTMSADYDFFELFELEFTAGESFQRDRESDKKAVILNEAAVKAIGWEEPIGRQYITQNGDTGKVVGILKDFNQHSLHLGIEPLQVFFQSSQRRVSVKLNGTQLKETVAAIEQVFNSYEPEYPFDYSYFDDIFNRAYESDMKTSQLAQWFTLLTIVVACLGLYGLAAHKVQKRVKEVGVRKVLGASVSRILLLLTKEFVMLLTIAFIIAAPIAYYIMQSWLEGFVFHISINALTFLGPLFIMLLVAGLTVGYRTYRAAVCNPVESLREE